MIYLSIPFGSTAEAMYVRRLEQLQAESARLREELFGEKNRLIWLHSHCLALGLNDQSDSGKIEENMALSVIRLREELTCTKDILEQTRVELAASEKMRNVWQCAFEESRVELASAQLDAARYRFMRNNDLNYCPLCYYDGLDQEQGETLDTAIDNAIKEVGHE